jgi:hypothetical protein
VVYTPRLVFIRFRTGFESAVTASAFDPREIKLENQKAQDFRTAGKASRAARPSAT